MSLPIYQRVAVTDAGDVIPGAEYTVINENTGVAAPIYSDRTGATLLSAPYFADSVGTIQFFIAQGTTFRVAASGGVGTYTDRYIYGISEAVFVSDNGNVNVNGTFTADSLIASAASGTLLNLTATDAGTPQNLIKFNDTGGTTAFLGHASSGSDHFYIQNSTAAGDILLNTNGNVGIGTSTPTFKLDVAGNARASYFAIRTNEAVPAESAFMYRPSTGVLGFGTSGFERMRIDGSGNLLVGKTALNTNAAGLQLESDGYLSACRTGGNVLLVNRKSSNGAMATFQKDGTTVGNVFVTGSNMGIGSSDTGLLFANTVNAILPFNANTFLERDNAIDLGRPTIGRFNDAYVTNGVTSGSDRTQKQDILEITTAEYNVAKACKGLLRSFRWIDAVEKKGDDARIHFGIMAQDLQDAFTAEGLDAGRYAMFMSNTWWETQTEVEAIEAVEGVEFVQAVEAFEAVYSEDGELISEAVEAVEGVEGVEAVEAKDAYTRTDTFETLAEAPEGATERTRLGVRYSELLAFIIAAL